MMRFRPRRASVTMVAVWLWAVPAVWAGQVTGAARAQFKEATMIIEFNSSAEDVGIQFFLDAEEWQSVKIFDPQGNAIFNAAASGRLLDQGGGTELFLESVEPALADLPLEEFFARFPEGEYRFLGRTAGGFKVTSRVEFSHDIPAGPDIVTPPQPEDGCAEDVPIPAVIAWNAVTESIDGEPLDIVGYQVIVENEDHVFDVKLPGDANRVTVPAEFLAGNTEYAFEILAIAEGGNQTITEGCLVTAR